MRGMIVAAGVVFGAAAGAAEPELVKPADVPFGVKAAAALAAPGVETFGSVARVEADGGGPKDYQLIGKTKAGKLVVVVTTAGGKVRWVLAEIRMADVPAAARDAVANKLPAFKPADAMTAGPTDEADKAFGYRYEGTGRGGKRVVVLVSRDGKVVEVVAGGDAG